MAVDAAGNVYIADTNNSRILKVTPSGSITKTTTVAGTQRACGYSGDGGPATSAQLNYPYGVALDAAGNLYIADTNNQRIRRVSAATGIITTVAGTRLSGYTGDGGPATSARTIVPAGGIGGCLRQYLRLGYPEQRDSPDDARPARHRRSGYRECLRRFQSIAPGTWIEIYGSNLAADSRDWTGAISTA